MRKTIQTFVTFNYINTYIAQKNIEKANYKAEKHKNHL